MANTSSKTNRPKTVYNKATGKHQKPATRLNAVDWWWSAAGLGGRGKGKGKAATNRKSTIDSNIDKMTMKEGEKRWPLLLPNGKQ